MFLVNLEKHVYENKMACFKALINDEMLNIILANTNKRFSSSPKITLVEIKGFIGLLLLFGVKNEKK